MTDMQFTMFTSVTSQHTLQTLIEHLQPVVLLLHFHSEKKDVINIIITLHF